MNKNKNKSAETTETSTKIAKTGPGRPKYQPIFPKKDKWTFQDFCAANGVDTETGKGNTTILTLRKYLKRDMFNAAGNVKGSSIVMQVKGEFAKTAKGTLGRKGFLYSLRNPVKTAKQPKVAKADVSVNVGKENTETPVSDATAAYEAKKAELLSPSETPVSDPAPVATPEIATA